MQIIIFSYNRAMQLSALIHSFLKWWEGDDYSIDVIYNTSSNEYERGYELLQDSLSSNMNIRFSKEKKVSITHWSIGELTSVYNIKLLYLCPFLRRKKTNFRDILLRIMKSSKYKSTMFLTDDSVFIRPINFDKNIENWICERSLQRQFSFRHGVELMPHGGDIAKIEIGYQWTFTQYEKSNHWGYNFSLDAHVYCTQTMYQFLCGVTFSNPNTLESSGILHSSKKNVFWEGQCGNNVAILSFPINIVQRTFDNKALNADVKTLNDYFLKGFQLRYTWEEIKDFQQYPDTIEVFKDGVSVNLLIR